MKKTVKVISTILIALMLVTTIANIAFAIDPSQITGNPGSVDSNNEVVGMGQKIMTLIQVLGIVLSVIILAFLGIKYMVGSPEEKGEYKKSMIPYIIGAILIFASTSIASGIYKLVSK